VQGGRQFFGSRPKSLSFLRELVIVGALSSAADYPLDTVGLDMRSLVDAQSCATLPCLLLPGDAMRAGSVTAICCRGSARVPRR